MSERVRFDASKLAGLRRKPKIPTFATSKPKLADRLTALRSSGAFRKPAPRGASCR